MSVTNIRTLVGTQNSLLNTQNLLISLLYRNDIRLISGICRIYITFISHLYREYLSEISGPGRQFTHEVLPKTHYLKLIKWGLFPCGKNNLPKT